MRFLIPATFALVCASALAAEPEKKALGRSINQRFSPTMEEQQALVFDPRSGAVGNSTTFNTGSAQTKDFHFSKGYAPAKFQTGEFTQTKKSWFGKLNFFSKSANLQTKSGIPNADTDAPLKAAPMKTASTKEAWDSSKKAATRDLQDGSRQYLGPESKKLHTAVDPKELANWRNGSENVTMTGTSVEKFSTLKQLSVEDVKEILNKNK